jgi:hypothetical protein
MGCALGKILAVSTATRTGIGRGTSAHFVTCTVKDLRFCHFISDPDARAPSVSVGANSLAAPRASEPKSESSPPPQLEVSKGVRRET